MPHCPRCKKGVATELFVYPDNHKGFICKGCLEGLKFSRMGKEERLAYLKNLETELEIKEAGTKPGRSQ
jgi:transposase-like protein